MLVVLSSPSTVKNISPENHNASAFCLCQSLGHSRPLSLLFAKSTGPSDEMMSSRGSYLACVYYASDPRHPACVWHAPILLYSRDVWYVFWSLKYSFTGSLSCHFSRRSTDAPGTILENRKPSILVQFSD